MNTDEINRAIAEHVGARFFTEDGGAFWHFVMSDGLHFGPPTEDLNACAQFEESLVGEDLRTLYLDRLYAIVCDDWAQKWEREWFAMAAKAPQRCEAFLRTIGKWRDS